MRKLVEIARTGVDSLLLHPMRSAATVACLVVMLVPFLAGLGISQGVRDQADDAVRFGADLYVTGQAFGRSAPVPLEFVAEVEQFEGVSRVVPRIVGRLTLGKDHVPAIVVGIPRERLEELTTSVRGRLFKQGAANELVVGTQLARKLKLDVGARIPPFYRSSQGERVSTVVGVFETDVSLWQANVIFTSFDTAAAIFDDDGRATDLAVFCRPGYQAGVAAAIRRGAPPEFRPRVTSREELEALFPRELLHREGIFSVHFLLAFAVGIPVVLVTSGTGLAGRRREVGILKALGWQTDEVLLRGLVESFCLSVLAGSISILLAAAWLRGLNGFWIAGMFLTGVDAWPSFPIPFRLAPVPALVGLLISLVVVMTGTIYSTWRAAVAPPSEAMR